jgi:hypothetical protein
MNTDFYHVTLQFLWRLERRPGQTTQTAKCLNAESDGLNGLAATLMMKELIKVHFTKRGVRIFPS